MVKVKKIVVLFLTGSIVGLIIGAGNFINEMITNRYIQQKMFRIAFQSLPYFLNKWILFSSLIMAVMIVLYAAWPLLARLMNILWKPVFPDMIEARIHFHIKDRLRSKRVVVIIFCLLFFFYGGWALNRFWLPHKFHVISLISNGLFLLLTLFMGWFLIRTEWRTFLNRITETRNILKLACFPVIFLLVSNLYPLIDRKTNVPDGPNVIFICIDALRADHLGCYGYGRETSPFIDQLSRNGVLFSNATSESSWTKTSAAVYLTSNYKMLKRIIHEEDKLPPYVNTLAEILKNQGYTTGAFVANPFLIPQFGFRQGFDYYNMRGLDDKGFRIKVEDIVNYMDRIKEKKFFVYIHFMDVHSPYEPPAPYDKMFTGEKGSYQYRNGPMKINKEDLVYTMGLYDGEIRYVDEKINNLFKYLKRVNLLNNTLIILNSDHGDEFLEHRGMGHGTTLYRELLHVPLLIVCNDDLQIEEKIIRSNVRNIDILPTILDILKISPAGDIDGASLLPLMRGENDLYSPSPALAGVKSVYFRDRFISVSKDGYKFIHNTTREMSELYDLQNDPLEKQDLMEAAPEAAGKIRDEMLTLLADYIDAVAPPSAKTSLDSRTLKTLKSLGYIE